MTPGALGVAEQAGGRRPRGCRRRSGTGCRAVELVGACRRMSRIADRPPLTHERREQGDVARIGVPSGSTPARAAARRRRPDRPLRVAGGDGSTTPTRGRAASSVRSLRVRTVEPASTVAVRPLPAYRWCPDQMSAAARVGSSAAWAWQIALSTSAFALEPRARAHVEILRSVRVTSDEARPGTCRGRDGGSGTSLPFDRRARRSGSQRRAPERATPTRSLEKRVAHRPGISSRTDVRSRKSSTSGEDRREDLVMQVLGDERRAPPERGDGFRR